MSPFSSALRAYVESRSSRLTWWNNVPGLTLRLDFSESCGASVDFLKWWAEGEILDAAPDRPSVGRNHPSLATHDTWADKEWARCAALGKVSFFPRGAPRPTGLHVSPCALLLKVREGVTETTEDHDRYKARLIVDLRRGRVNHRLPHIGVSYGTVDMAVSRLQAGPFIFKIDLQDSFFNWKVAPEDSWQLGFIRLLANNLENMILFLMA